MYTRVYFCIFISCVNAIEGSILTFFSDVTDFQVLSLEGLSPVAIMARRKKDPATTTVHEVLATLQTWMDGKETIKATLAQSYLNIHRIALGSAGGVWSVLRQARDRLAHAMRQSASHRTALLLHVPAPLHGVPYHTHLLMQRRGHLGGYCPVHLTSTTNGSTTGSESRLTATGHGTCHQRAYGCVYHGRVYSCSSLAALNAFARSPVRIACIMF